MKGAIRIVDSEFRGNGKCEAACAHGIYINGIDRLDIEHSRFLDQHVGHHIKSRARSTVLIDNDIADGSSGDSSYLIDIPNGGVQHAAVTGVAMPGDGRFEKVAGHAQGAVGIDDAWR